MIPAHVAAFVAGILSIDANYSRAALADLIAVLGFGRWSSEELVSAAAQWAKLNVPDGYHARVEAFFAAHIARRKAGQS